MLLCVNRSKMVKVKMLIYPLGDLVTFTVNFHHSSSGNQNRQICDVAGGDTNDVVIL